MQNKTKLIKDILARPNHGSDEEGLLELIEVSESENKILSRMFFWRKTYHFTFFALLSVVSTYMIADIASETFAWLYSQKWMEDVSTTPFFTVIMFLGVPLLTLAYNVTDFILKIGPNRPISICLNWQDEKTGEIKKQYLVERKWLETFDK